LTKSEIYDIIILDENVYFYYKGVCLMITLPQDIYEALQLLHAQQKYLIHEIDNDYAKGFYDGLEVVMAAIESRTPELCPINADSEVLM